MTPPSSSNSAPHTSHASLPLACVPTVPSGISGVVSPLSVVVVFGFRVRGAFAGFVSFVAGSAAIGGSPTVQNAHPLQAFPVIAVPAAEGLLNSRPSARR